LDAEKGTRDKNLQVKIIDTRRKIKLNWIRPVDSFE
jgi:hypothetical protein